MKPTVPALVVCTATGNLAEALPRISRWQALASFEWPLVIVENGGVTDLRPSDGTFTIERRAEWLGSVPAMALAMHVARKQYGKAAEVVCAFHDDLEIDEDAWDAQILGHFGVRQPCGLAGFSGATGLGSVDLYTTPYSPMQLARHDFRSNLRDAEAHGVRGLRLERVVCHDGFALIGRAAWWLWGKRGSGKAGIPPWEQLQALGMKHHAYDSAMGLLAHLAGWESWYLPIGCHHLGGRTAVANRAYQAWAESQEVGGDHGFWEQAHRALYELGRGVLPLRVGR